MTKWQPYVLAVLLAGVSGSASAAEVELIAAHSESALDQQLAQLLANAGFTGRIESTLEQRLGRRLDHKLADLGREIFFDNFSTPDVSGPRGANLPGSAVEKEIRNDPLRLRHERLHAR